MKVHHPSGNRDSIRDGGNGHKKSGIIPVRNFNKKGGRDYYWEVKNRMVELIDMYRDVNQRLEFDKLKLEMNIDSLGVRFRQQGGHNKKGGKIRVK